MTRAEILLLRSQHKMAIDLAICFIEQNPHHSFKIDLERTIVHNTQCISELDQWLQDIK